MRHWIFTLLATVLLASVAAAQGAPPEKEPTPAQRPSLSRGKTSVPGPRGKAPIIGQVYIGERAPDFVLDASNGLQEQLSHHRGKWVLLVFDDRYRALADYDTLDIQAAKLGARVIGVCHEKQQLLMTARTREGVNMLLLADATGEVSAVYGLYDWGASTTEPGFFVIDRDGTVRLAIVGKLFPADQMLELLKFATGMIE
jgi:peroxiredoxin